MTMTTPYGKTGIARNRPSAQRQANYDRAQLEQVDWEAEKPVSQMSTWRVVATTKVQEGAAFIPGRHDVIAVHPRTWRTISADMKAQAYFFESMLTGARGMKYLVMDSGPYGEAARAEARRNGTDVVMAKDLMTQVQEAAQSLIVQAAGLAGGATVLQMQAFHERYIKLEEDLTLLEHEVGRVRALVEIAGDTVAQAC
jgi:hypothetical protein